MSIYASPHRQPTALGGSSAAAGVSGTGIRGNVAAVSGADSALASANDTLRRVDATLLIGQRDIASISAEAQRALSTRDSKMAEAENQLHDQAAAMREIEEANAAVNIQLANSRRRLADLQVAVDAATAQVQQQHGVLSEQVRRVENTANTFEAVVNTEKNERRDIENRINHAEQQSRRLTDEVKVAISMRGPASSAHSDRTTETRRRVEALRRDIDNKKTELGAVVQALDDNAKQADEANRKFARSLDDRVAQFITERRVTTQQQTSERHSREREVRQETERQADELRSRVTALTDAIAQFKDVESRGLQKEMELHDQIALAKEKLVGKDALEARLSSAEQNLMQRQLEVRQLEGDCAAAREQTAQLSQQITSYENTLAPLPDVEASVRSYATLLQSKQQEIADRTADQALWLAKHQETAGMAKRALEGALHQIEEKKRRREAALGETQTEANAARDQTRVLEDQLRNMDLELKEMMHRNELAERRLATAREEHEREEAETRRRKETARQAAANLLASLAE